MAVSIPIVYDDRQRLHEPGGEIWVGVRTPGTEVPARAECIRDALVAAGAPVVAAEPAPDGDALRFHDPEMVGWLRHSWGAWEAAGLPGDPGQDRVVPYLFPHPGLVGDLPVPVPAAVTARAGRWCFDTMTLIGPGTWEAARGALDVAITAAAIAARDGVAYGCCRPPGHHATRDAYGGSCYLNNAAAAAGALRDAVGGPVAILDIDAHHGNGAQSIFWDDPAVVTGSVHVDPGAGWFPHFLGFGGERGGDDAAAIESERPARSRLRRRRVAGGGRTALRARPFSRRARPRDRARGRRGGRRSGEPARSDCRRVSRRGRAARRPRAADGDRPGRRLRARHDR